ncbi:MAG: serine/threonine-protein kinase [Planctomycetota bacterium]|jgi:serine/threonine-protein kinase|nr:serine/threonine-protein kinase [Planctomycetota bacterium]
MAQEDESIPLEEMREFFRIAEVRQEESGLFRKNDSPPVPKVEQDYQDNDDEDFSPEEARRLLWEAEEMKQPVVGYQILEKLGTGGSATVFKARDMNLDRVVALKLLYPALAEDRKSLKTFVQEGMVMIRLQHPNILEGYDFGFSKGFYFQVLEFIEGIAVDQYLDRGKRVREAEAVRIALEVGRAIEHLQSKRIVHRDIKPANILIVKRKGVKLCDFGLSLDLGKLAGGPGDQSDVTVGTIEYMSPEQAVGSKDLDVRADLYSLGVTLFHMVSGRLPFDAENREDILEKQVKESLSFEGVESLFSDSLKDLIHRLMAKDREKRPPNAKSFLQEIKAISGSKS